MARTKKPPAQVYPAKSGASTSPRPTMRASTDIAEKTTPSSNPSAMIASTLLPVTWTSNAEAGPAAILSAMVVLLSVGFVQLHGLALLTLSGGGMPGIGLRDYCGWDNPPRPVRDKCPR